VSRVSPQPPNATSKVAISNDRLTSEINELAHPAMPLDFAEAIAAALADAGPRLDRARAEFRRDGVLVALGYDVAQEGILDLGRLAGPDSYGRHWPPRPHVRARRLEADRQRGGLVCPGVPGAILVFVGLVIIFRGKCDGYVCADGSQTGAAGCDVVSAIAVDRSRIVICGTE
jgi:hypothetical protein